MTNPIEAQNWLLGAGVAVQCGLAIATGLVVLGKWRGGSAVHEKSQNTSLADLSRKQAILEQLVNDARIKANSADEKIDSHEDRCALSYQELRTDMRAGFDRIEARLNAMGRAARGAE